MRAKFTNYLALGVLWLASITASITLFSLIGYIFWNGLPAIDLDFILTPPRGIEMKGGIFPTIVASLYVTLLAVLIATPVGVGGAIYLTEYAREGKVTRFIRFMGDSLASVPSIVFGLFGISLFVYILGLGWCILSGALTLAFMILPVIIRTSEEAIKAVPDSYREGSFGLGATKWQTIKNVILPTASPGILTGVILGMGRAFGETAAVMYTAGMALNIPKSPLDTGRTMTLHLYLLITQGGSLKSAFGTAFLLLAIVLMANLTTTGLMRRFRARYIA
ncbi:MAG: phosphate ABC transporter permease PstA [Actinomycetota bacterium]